MAWGWYQRRAARRLAREFAVLFHVFSLIGLAASAGMLVVAGLSIAAQQKADRVHLLHMAATEAIMGVYAVYGVRLLLWRRFFRRVAPRRYMLVDLLLVGLLIALAASAVEPPDGYAAAALGVLIVALLALSALLPRLSWMHRKPPRTRYPLKRPSASAKSPPPVH